MVEERIGYRYAKSIFDLAKEQNLLDEVKGDMDLLHTVCEQNKDFVLMLKSPLIQVDKKRKVLNQIFGDNFSSKLTPLLIEIVLKKHREAYIDFIAEGYIRLYDVEKHLSHVTIVSAKEMDQAQLDQIKTIVEKQTGDTVDLIVKIDPALIGGFTLKIGDKLFDGSIASRLRKVKQDFEKNTYIKKV